MKFLIGLFTAILISGIAGAQHGNSPSGHVNLGIKGGLNVYNVHNDNGIRYDQRTGFHLGLLGHIHWDSHFAIQPELVYSTQGAKNYNLDYINVPVLFQYMFDNGFRLQAGPQVGFLIRADNKNDLKPIDISLSIGASYVHPPTGIGFDARYNLGFTNINKTSSVNSTNRGLQVGLFYIFGHKVKKL